MPEPFDFAQKIALVAGGTGGLGALIATELRARGCIVTTVSRSPISDDSHISADLRSPEAISAVMNSIVERHGGLDIVVNAMGVVAFGTVDATSIDTIEELFLTNTFAHIFLMKEALKCARQGSVLVGISGVIAEQNLPGMATYGASKARFGARRHFWRHRSTKLAWYGHLWSIKGCGAVIQRGTNSRGSSRWSTCH